MAINIETYLSNILTAVYGEEVRGSIHDALEVMSEYVGFTILGHYDNYDLLVEAHPTGKPGDYYTAGVNLYTWNNNQWEFCGRLTGRGIVSIELSSTSGLVDTYQVNYDDSTTSTFNVTNGNGVLKIEKTATNVLVDTYTITYDNGNSTTFEVTNGKAINTITKKGTSGLVDTYEISFNDNTTQEFTVTNGNGIGNIALSGTDILVDHYKISFTDGTDTSFDVTNGRAILNIEKTNTSGLVDTYTITYNDETTSTFTVTNGEKGDTGNAATIQVGTVEATESGGNPEIVNSGDEYNAVFDFKLPRGIQGEKGDKGYSPAANVVQSGDQITITITDESGTTETSFVPGGTYVLPQATSTALGGIKANAATEAMTADVGIDADGFLKVTPETPYELPMASSELGGVKANTATATMTGEVGIDTNGYLKYEPYSLPIATSDVLGGVKPISATDAMTSDVGVTSDGLLKTTPYTITQATDTALGGVKVTTATSEQTESVGIDSAGLLKVKPQTSEIDDTQAASDKTYSSTKIESAIAEAKCKVYSVNCTISSYTENSGATEAEAYYADVPVSGVTESMAVINTTPASSVSLSAQALLTYAETQADSIRCYFSAQPEETFIISLFIVTEG